ncbi:MAG: addiction module toxin RelE [Bacteroidales bacterium]|nr:addiction module toxin RelE [Bacteroidales bacterium]
MNLNIISLDSFNKDIKRLFKKYKQIINDLKILKDILVKNPKQGVELGHNCFKIRLANSSIPTGKRSGFRVIYYYLDQQNNLFLMSIYSKSELDNISDEKIIEILKNNHLS